MTDNRTQPKPTGRFPAPTVRSACRYCLFFASMAIYGCSSPQPEVSPPLEELTPVVTVTTPLPAAAESPPPIAAKKLTEAVSDENIIFFAAGSTSVDDAGNEKLRQHADRLKQLPKKRVTLTGYGDDQGSRNVNLAIAEQRLVAVSKALRAYGASPRQIRRNRIGGVKKPSACSSPDCRRRMSRVELVYSP